MAPGQNTQAGAKSEDNAPKTAAAPKPAAAKPVKRYEVVGSVNLGKGDVRAAGSEIREDEIPAQLRRDLLAGSFLRDADAPVPPSQADAALAFARLTSVAQKTGAIVREGGEIRFGEQTFTGLEAFRAAVTLDELEAAIVATAQRFE